MSKKRRFKRPLSIIDLPFRSILDKRPSQGHFVLIAWEMNGSCGYCSIIWDLDDKLCQHAVAWLPIMKTHVFTKSCGLVLKRHSKMPLLKWNHHYSTIVDKKYISKDKLPRVAATN